MPYATLGPAQRDADLQRLDDLLAALGHTQENRDDLLIEHLHSARTYLLGAMPEEYALSLQNARDNSSLVRDETSRQRLESTLSSLLNEIEHAGTPRDGGRKSPAARMDRDRYAGDGCGSGADLFAFFKGAKTSMGVFYPWKYVIATFPSFEAAKAAGDALRQAGMGPDEVMAVAGEEMLRFFEQLRTETSLFGALMEGLSRVIATEAAFVEADIRRAREGAGFVAIYHPDEADTQRLRELLVPLGPVSMHWYRRGSIESLI
jgi:hypothetical protein